jgi:hypothetical protein
VKHQNKFKKPADFATKKTISQFLESASPPFTLNSMAKSQGNYFLLTAKKLEPVKFCFLRLFKNKKFLSSKPNLKNLKGFWMTENLTTS